MTPANALQEASLSLITVDIRLPAGNGAPLNVVMLLIAVPGNEGDVVDLLNAGKDQYCPVITPLNQLVENVQNIITQGRATSPQATRRILDLLAGPRSAGMPAGQLTPHETRLLKLIVDGHTYKSAAEILHVSYHTVDFHLRAIYEKLQAHSKSDAVGKALRQGLV
jgi:DNA-binding NarL/FixJ family response regulator